MSIKGISTASAESTSSYSTLPYFDPEETSTDYVDSLFSVTRSSEIPEYRSTKITFPGSLNPYRLPELSPPRQIMPLTTSSHGAQVASTIASVSSSILKERSSYSSSSSDSSPVQFSSKNERRKTVRFTLPSEKSRAHSLSNSSSSSMDSTSFSSSVPLQCKDIGCSCSSSRSKPLISELNELMMFRGMVSSTDSSQKSGPLMTFQEKAKETPYCEAVRCLSELEQKMLELGIEVFGSGITNEEIRKIKIGQLNFLFLVQDGLKQKQMSLMTSFPHLS